MVFEFIYSIEPIYSILLISFLVSLLMTVLYKLMTDQKVLKEHREELKKLQKKMKEHKGDHAKLMQIQKRILEINKTILKHSFKPTLITLLPLLLIFSWMSAHFAYEPLKVNNSFKLVIVPEVENLNITLNLPNEITLLNKSYEKNNYIYELLPKKEGKYILDIVASNKSYTKEILVTSEQRYMKPRNIIKDGIIKEITVIHKKLKVFLSFGWLATYIISSIFFSFLLRKLFKVY